MASRRRGGRKVVIDSDNNTPPWMDYCQGFVDYVKLETWTD